MDILNSPAAHQWNRIGIKHHHGINVPLFSIHSSKSTGIGEYPDLIPLIDWCSCLGLDVLQLLPLNDTGKDSSPYNALSAYALNPIHIGLEDLPNIGNYPALIEKINKLKKLTGSQWIEYPLVQNGKEQILREYFAEEGKQLLLSESFVNYLKDNSYWLNGYALFKALKIKNDWNVWTEWPEKYPTDKNSFNVLFQKHDSEIHYHMVLQYLAYQQLAHVKRHAHEKKVWLKGDIPILISKDSADVWFRPDIFNLNLVAGAPPDMYTVEGQKWGFPIYQWEKLAEEDYKWWRQRLKYAEQFYDIYRIDHVVGFFRIWAIPEEKRASEGYFVPDDENLWIDQGRKLMLMMLASSSMLPIAEDLGTVNLEIRQCLRELGICGTKVMRWERYWEGNRYYIPYFEYPLESMTTVSTHDSETVFMWWFDQVEEAKAFAQFKRWTYTSELGRKQQKEILWDSHRTASLFHVNLLPEYLMLIKGMHWLNPVDERINLPGVISSKNWCYRCKPSLEEIIHNQELRNLMCQLVP